MSLHERCGEYCAGTDGGECTCPCGQEGRDLVSALRAAKEAFDRAKHTSHNALTIKDYWTRYARPASQRIETVLARRSRRGPG